MSKFLVTSGSTFEPFSYDELVKPVILAQEAHNKAQDAYDQLSLETSALQRYITDRPDDANAKQLYDNYMSKLNTLQNNLWSNGIGAQTRRDLSAARTAYASDIARLQKAITARQERSKAYWDMKHQHPDLIMSADPGASGLDNYLNDDNYGIDYYNYSGESFASEVGIDAKNRVGERHRELEYDGKSIPGYITRIEQTGFTSEEVANAYNAVKESYKSGDQSFSNLTEPEKILADTLISRLNSTGAHGKVSESEFERLIDYGRLGLSNAIGKTEMKDLSDKVWDWSMQMRLAKMKTPKGSGKTGAVSTPYSFNSQMINLKTAGYDKLSKSLKGEYKAYEGGVKMLKDANGDYTEVSDPWQMAQIVFNPGVRQAARREFGGLDVALPGNKTGKLGEQTGHIVDRNGKEWELKTRDLPDKVCDSLGLPHGSIGIYSNNHLQEGMTKKFNDYKKAYDEHVAAYREANPDMDFDDIAISPKKERELREKYGIDAGIDSSDIMSVVMTKENVSERTPATLTSTDSGDDYSRDNYGRALISSFNSASSNGTVSKGSPYAFYRVGEGGIAIDQKGVTDIKKVFGEKPDPKTVTSITALPEDIAAGAGQGRPKLRFSTTTSKDVWAADASMFGNQVWSALKTPLYNSGRFAGYTVCDVVDYLMMPLKHPDRMLQMGDDMSSQWSLGMYALLNDAFGYPEGPVVYEADGTPNMVTGKDIVRNPELRNELYDVATQYINIALRAARDENSSNHPQNTANSSTKPSTYME